MKRLLLLALTAAVGAVLALPASASAEPSTHEKATVSLDVTEPAGTLCDFNYSSHVTIEFNDIFFGDPNNPTMIIDHQTQFVTHINVDTGYTLTEVDNFTNTYDLTGSTQHAKTVGIVWHLRDPSGKIVVVDAGQFLIDLITFEVLKVTPNFGPQAAAVICPALGGHPAI